MANLKDLIVTGPIRAISGVIGDLTGTASKAIADADGNTISTTYLKSANLKSKGSSTQPIYFDANGAAQNTAYTLAKSVPSDALFTDTVYTHPTTSGNKHIPSGGSSGQFLKWSADGTATWAADNNTTYTAGTGLSLSGTTFNHVSSVTAATQGTSAATSGSTLTIPYVTYNASGHITAAGTHTHTVTGFLTGHQTIKINGITGATSNNFGTCSTAAGTAEKAVALTAGTFNLETGASVKVKFTVTNTAANPTLNVASKGAKPIYYRGSAISAGYLAANRTYEFVYDGTNFNLVGDINTDTNNVTAQNISTANDTYPILLGNTANATANIGNKATLFGSGIKANPSTSTIVATTFSGNATSATTASKLGTADVGSATQGIYLDNGVAKACTYTIAKSVPSDANFSNTTYSAGTGMSLSGTTFNHAASITAGTVGTSAASSGSTLTIPYVTYNATGHITATGTRTHTVSGFATSDTKNTAGSTDTSSKIFLIGATSQAANPQTYSHDTVFIDTAGALNSVTPAAGNNTTKVATTAFVTTAIGSYVKKAGDTMTGALNFANNTWNNMGDDAMIGDHNVGGHVCIAPKNATYDNSGGLSFHNSSGTALVQLNASSGALTSSGALGLSNNAAKMQYNSTTEAIEFVFA